MNIFDVLHISTHIVVYVSKEIKKNYYYCLQNPSKPHFNHYLFETFSLAIRIVCRNNKNAVLSFEEALFPVFENILQQDIQGMFLSFLILFCFLK